MGIIEKEKYYFEEVEQKEKSLEEILKSCILLIDKHKGPTSYAIDKFIADCLKIKKIGHAGTLDPNATGLLLILINKANKAMDVLKSLDKKYVGIIYFHKDFDEELLRKVIAEKFIGEIIQVPPVRSAVARVPRRKKIYYFDILEIEGRNVLFEVSCEAGVYVRKLAVDIGKEIGVNAHLKELRRISIGNFSIKNAISIHEFKEVLKNGEELKKVLLPTNLALSFMKKIFVKSTAIPNLIKGSPLFVNGIVKLDDNINENDIVAIYSLDNEIIAIGIAKMNSEEIVKSNKGLAVKIDKVLLV